MITRKYVKFVNLASSLVKIQGCQFSGKSLNSGHGNLFSGHMFHFLCTNWTILDTCSFQAHLCFLTGNPEECFLFEGYFSNLMWYMCLIYIVTYWENRGYFFVLRASLQPPPPCVFPKLLAKARLSLQINFYWPLNWSSDEEMPYPSLLALFYIMVKCLSIYFKTFQTGC